MYDPFERRITSLRISVTERCNLRCTYCMPEEGVPARSPGEFLSFEQIVAVARAAVGLGITKVRLTGGEPLVRRGIVDLVRMIAGIDGLDHLAMSTNGTLLAPHARELKEAGLHSVNISLDTLDPVRYSQITRGGRMEDALAGMRAAVAEGFPVKINMVVMPDTTPAEIEGMRGFCSAEGARLQRIRLYSLRQEKTDAGSFDRPHACESCNRIRLTADGMLKPCLHSDSEVALDFSHLADSLRAAVLAKPKRGSVCVGRAMPQIGG